MCSGIPQCLIKNTACLMAYPPSLWGVTSSDTAPGGGTPREARQRICTARYANARFPPLRAVCPQGRPPLTPCVMAGHRCRDAQPGHVGCAILTVSDTRTEADDLSGAAIRTLLGDAGHAVKCYALVPDDVVAIRRAVTDAVQRTDVMAVIVNGGTGISDRDTTVESLAGLWTKELPGFGELFRMLSFAEIGAAALLSRATAGVVAGKFVAVLPGSPAACRLALERLILPELGHVAALLAPAS